MHFISHSEGCFLAMWICTCAFCLALYGHKVQPNRGSIPQPLRRCARRDDLSLYGCLQLLHTNFVSPEYSGNFNGSEMDKKN